MIFVPAYIQPLKGELLFPPSFRFELLKVSIEDNPRFSLWDVEIKSKRVSYTVETLRLYWEKRKRKPLFLMGIDSLLTFHLWKEPEEILKLSTLIVANRGDYKPEMIENYLKDTLGLSKEEFSFELSAKDILSLKVLVLRTRRIDISSTEIRSRIRKGKSIKYLVPQKVEEMIRRSKCL